MIISTDNSVLRSAIGDIEAMRLIAEAGFDGIDYSFYGISPDNDILEFGDAEREKLAFEIKEYAGKAGLVFPQCHAELAYKYGNIEIGEHHPVYRRVVRSLEYASRIGCPQAVIHTLRCPLDMDDETSDIINLEFMRSFIPYAEKYGVRIGVENLFKNDKKNARFIGRHHTPEWMNSFLEKLGSDIFRVCVDTGHAEICGTRADELIRGITPGKLTMLHVQDTDLSADRHWLPMLGSHDWEALTSALAETGYEGSMNLEVLHFYDRFPPELFGSALKLAADTARYLARRVEEKRVSIGTGR